MSQDPNTSLMRGKERAGCARTCARDYFQFIHVLFTAGDAKEHDAPTSPPYSDSLRGEPFDSPSTSSGSLRVISGSALLDSLTLIFASLSQR
ncbi:MAG: hypothetical protein PHX87_04060 [Candidatus Peribacteraceae bacterium]|nr:hypothetical protein [Candidatus Peribacteraceae bacterium]MDD5742578.1 hypothetical protein [Candidatus Peribacteraceae bacterium]